MENICYSEGKRKKHACNGGGYAEGGENLKHRCESIGVKA